MANAEPDETPEPSVPAASVKIRGEKVNVFYGNKQALFDVDLDMRANQVISLIGPSGCGKSTFLRCLNRMNDVIDICRVGGKITLDDEDIYNPSLDVVELARTRRHGLPETEPFSEIDLRERRLRPAHSWLDQKQGGAR